jgi:hypothetical protein
MTGETQTAIVVVAGSLATIVLNRWFNLQDARVTREKIDKGNAALARVEMKTDGMLEAQLSSARQIAHFEGEKAGAQEERNRTP